MKPSPPDNLWEKMDKLHEDLDMPVSNAEFADGFTADDYARKYRVTNWTARWRLNRMIKEGKIIAGWKNNGEGHRIRVYRFA